MSFYTDVGTESMLPCFGGVLGVLGDRDSSSLKFSRLLKSGKYATYFFTRLKKRSRPFGFLQAHSHTTAQEKFCPPANILSNGSSVLEC